MARKVQELFREAAALSEAERADLAALLIDSLEEPEADVEQAWAEEIAKRVHELESGQVQTIPWEEVRRKLFARIHEEP